ncbi:MAG: hypothetical protein ABIH23_18710 [bacterium]
MAAPTPPTSFITPLADFIADLLRGPGELFRSWLIAIDVTAAKGIFIAYFVLLIIWVLTLRKDEVNVKNERTGKMVNLRPYAIAALVSQVIIYLIY